MPRQRNAGKGLMLDTIPDLDQDLADQDDGDDDQDGGGDEDAPMQDLVPKI